MSPPGHATRASFVNAGLFPPNTPFPQEMQDSFVFVNGALNDIFPSKLQSKEEKESSMGMFRQLYQRAMVDFRHAEMVQPALA
jgi:hypothetical protein